MSRDFLLKEIEMEGRRGDSFFRLATNSIDIYLSIGFVVFFTFFIQAYFLKKREILVETGFIDFLIFWGAFGSLILFCFIIFQMKYWQKKADNSKKRCMSLAKQYVGLKED